MKDDAGVCAPDPLPDATVSFPSMRGEAVPDRARDCRLDGECNPLRPTPDEVTIAAGSMASDPEEKEEATPLVLDDGSPPSTAASAALFEVPPLLEISPNRAVPTQSLVDISPSGETQATHFFSFLSPVLAPGAMTADNLRNPCFFAPSLLPILSRWRGERSITITAGSPGIFLPTIRN